MPEGQPVPVTWCRVSREAERSRLSLARPSHFFRSTCLLHNEFVFPALQLKPVGAVITILPVRLGSKNDNDFDSQD
jgi:hypothetical protein